MRTRANIVRIKVFRLWRLTIRLAPTQRAFIQEKGLDEGGAGSFVMGCGDLRCAHPSPQLRGSQETNGPHIFSGSEAQQPPSYWRAQT